MGNIFCPALDFSHLTSVARDFCPYPEYTASPIFGNMLSINSSRHLSDHYTAVQSSLNPQQLEDFTQSLRRTFGRESRVSYGGVGVVALSLALLFDTLAKQAKGEVVSDSGPIPGLFYKDPRGYYPPHVYTVSEYLRLVPHIANNPTRMRDEAERYTKRLTDDDESMKNLDEKDMFKVQEDIPIRNWFLGKWFGRSLGIHLLRLKNGSINELVYDPGQFSTVILNLNCDIEKSDQEFKAFIQRSNDSKYDELIKHISDPKPLLLQVVELEWMSTVMQVSCQIANDDDLMLAQKEDFDLKANALGKWAE